jgi:hypothetical protein
MNHPLKLLLLLVASLAPAFLASAQQQATDSLAADCCHSRFPRGHLDAFPTAALAQEYCRLKRTPCAACNRYGSDFYELLKVLGVRLNGASGAAIKRMLGPPDTVKGRVLVYYWRGEHDYLRFTPSKAGASSSWYYAYE